MNLSRYIHISGSPEDNETLANALSYNSPYDFTFVSDNYADKLIEFKDAKEAQESLQAMGADLLNKQDYLENEVIIKSPSTIAYGNSKAEIIDEDFAMMLVW